MMICALRQMLLGAPNQGGDEVGETCVFMCRPI